MFKGGVNWGARELDFLTGVCRAVVVDSTRRGKSKLIDINKV